VRLEEGHGVYPLRWAEVEHLRATLEEQRQRMRERKGGI
jgi:hypothetical protein